VISVEDSETDNDAHPSGSGHNSTHVELLTALNVVKGEHIANELTSPIGPVSRRNSDKTNRYKGRPMSMEEWRNHPDNPRNTPKISPEENQRLLDEALATGQKWDVQERINARRHAGLQGESGESDQETKK
jgi:hypothetical protein